MTKGPDLLLEMSNKFYTQNGSDMGGDVILGYLRMSVFLTNKNQGFGQFLFLTVCWNNPPLPDI